MMPRELIDAGAVAIGGAQTGIYPMDSPGGWNIIGKTPINIFDVSLAKPSLFKAGDRIQFYGITKTEFDAITEKIKSGNYKLGKTLSDD
jgi:inhibitor of KinA